MKKKHLIYSALVAGLALVGAMMTSACSGTNLDAKAIEEKLAMLDALRERALTIRPIRAKSQTGLLREEPPAYRTRGRKSK